MKINGFGITSADQLRELANRLNVKINYIGFAEQLKHLPKPGFSIINLGDDTIGGTHWVLWYIDPQRKHDIYFDSYGAPPEDKIIELSKSDDIIINSKQVQGYYEQYCGIWAITAAAYLNRHVNKKKAFSDFIAKFAKIA